GSCRSARPPGLSLVVRRKRPTRCHELRRLRQGVPDMTETTTPTDAVTLIRTLCEAVGYNIAVWTRGGKGPRAMIQQKRAIIDVFTALTGRKPADEELDEMSATEVFWG